MRICALVGCCAFFGLMSASRADDATPPAVPTPAPVAAAAAAPAPTGAEAAWILNVQKMAGVLTGAVEPAVLRDVISPRAWMSPFERNRSESAIGIAGRLPTRNVVSVRAYLAPSVTSATDLAADIAANPQIADSIRKQILPPPARDLRLADQTMARWFSSALDVQEGDPCAVIALYDDGQANNSSPTLHLLLIRGEISPSDGVPRVTRVLYGTLDTAAR